MRFLHTGDWHIGKSLYGHSRLDEQRKLSEEIVGIAVREKIGCLLFAGDLYDSLAPTAEAEQLVYHFFGELAERRIRSVVIGGNHDHPRRLQAVRPVLDRLQIHVCAEVQRPADGGVIEFDAGGEKVRIAQLPWVWAAKLTPAEDALGPQDKLALKYLERIQGMIAQLTAGFTPDAVNVLLGHLYVANAEVSPGAERVLCTAQGYAVPAPMFPPTASYLALGHLHRPQEMAAPSPLYYCGSPMQLDFGEQGQSKRVVIVDAKAGRKAKIESIPLRGSRGLRDVRGTLAELTARAAEFGSDFLRVAVEVEQPQLGLAEKIREILPHAVQVIPELPASSRNRPAESTVEALSPAELFARYYARERGGEAPSGLIEAFTELYEEASGASR